MLSRTPTRRSLARRALAAALALALVAPVGAPGSSILQSAHAKPRTPAEEAAQRKQAGDAAMDALNYADALAAYTEAYALSKDPALLYNKGRVLQALARYPEALEQLEAFDHEAPPELRAKVPALAALLAEIRAKVSRLRLVANVSDARVLVRGSVVGKTPLAAPLALTAGPARVAVEAEGYFPFERELTLPGGETLELRAELVSRATTALLRVSADAKGASVWVDGKSLGAAPSESFVGAGAHVIVVRAADHPDEEQRVVVSAGERKEVHVHLREPEVWTRWWFWTGVGVAVLGGVAIGIAATSERDAERGDISPGQVSAPLAPALRF
jgi:hypothetical protein